MPKRCAGCAACRLAHSHPNLPAHAIQSMPKGTRLGCIKSWCSSEGRAIVDSAGCVVGTHWVEFVVTKGKMPCACSSLLRATPLPIILSKASATCYRWWSQPDLPLMLLHPAPLTPLQNPGWPNMHAGPCTPYLATCRQQRSRCSKWQNAQPLKGSRHLPAHSPSPPPLSQLVLVGLGPQHPSNSSMLQCSSHKAALSQPVLLCAGRLPQDKQHPALKQPRQ